MSTAVVSLGDSLLRESDVDLLRGPFWLNDSIISFYFEYLTLKKFKKCSDTLFVGPEVTHCLKAASKEELPIFLDPVHANTKKFVFFAFNDERTFETCGGTHWSLLLFSRPDMTIFHADSMSGTNFRQAAKFSPKLLSYFSPSGRGEFEELSCRQQDNSFDCGIYVLCHTDMIAEYCVKNNTAVGCGLLEKDEVTFKRDELLQLIEELAN